ncbi:hypothetical protein C8A01DRAFT_34823 [Parachaetomium inaequale]|uniref:Uncharacterized protein n=1 Tax=Parachaetomium inaequale TaxID=2588326 RepID=A0AAN6SS44_9PEZI|nr:hypothetical protein C8A01DRAFT_34823 [Parachaetomium inaequale]
MRNCTAHDALDRLWLARLWRRKPWTGPPVPPLDLREDSPAISTFLRCAARCGLPRLTTLPLELVEIIQPLSKPHFFWRYVAAIDLAARLSAGPSRPLQSVPLATVISWERGCAPVCGEERGDDSRPIIRLTVDCEGLRKIERLPGRPSYDPRRFDDVAFVVEEQRYFAAAVAHFKNGLLHLAIALMDHSLQVWATPAPPDLVKCLVRPERPAACMRLHTINLAEASGITFLMDPKSQPMEIHTHSKSTPCAKATFDRLDRRQWPWVWIYVPLPRRDPLTHFGCFIADADDYGSSDVPRFLMRTRLAGDTMVGLHCWGADGTGRFIVSDARPTTLIYATGLAPPISDIWPYSNSESRAAQTLSLVNARGYPRSEEFSSRHWYFSSAPLGDVGEIQIFFEDDGIHCRGLLLEYASGARKALGQCRLLVDRSKTYTSPSYIGFANVKGPPSAREPEGRPLVMVSFEDVPEDDGAWSRYAMVGTLRFWFAPLWSRLEIQEGFELRAS